MAAEARWRLVLGGALAAGGILAACAEAPGVPDETGHDGGTSGYTYPNCAASTAYCPNDLTLRCALDAVKAKFDACSDDGQCAVQLLPESCVGYGTCAPYAIINQASVEQYQAEARAELTRYCDGTDCQVSGQCTEPPSNYRALCIEGHCRAVRW